MAVVMMIGIEWERYRSWAHHPVNHVQFTFIRRYGIGWYKRMRQTVQRINERSQWCRKQFIAIRNIILSLSIWWKYDLNGATERQPLPFTICNINSIRKSMLRYNSTAIATRQSKCLFLFGKIMPRNIFNWSATQEVTEKKGNKSFNQQHYI